MKQESSYVIGNKRNCTIDVQVTKNEFKIVVCTTMDHLEIK